MNRANFQVMLHRSIPEGDKPHDQRDDAVLDLFAQTGDDVARPAHMVRQHAREIRVQEGLALLDEAREQKGAGRVQQFGHIAALQVFAGPVGGVSERPRAWYIRSSCVVLSHTRSAEAVTTPTILPKDQLTSVSAAVAVISNT